MPLKICMFVYNNCQHDSRVLKEAATLVQAGHQVRIVALLDDLSLPYEERDGFTIIRVPKNPLHRRIINRMGRFHFSKWLHDVTVKPISTLLKWIKYRFVKGLQGQNIASEKASKEPIDPKSFHGRVRAFGRRYIKKPLVYIWHNVLRNILRRCKSMISKCLMVFHRPFCFLDYYCRSYPIIKAAPADVYHAHDLNTMPLAYWLKKRTGGHLVYDSHEFYVERNRAHKASQFRKYLLKKFEGFFVKKTDHVITVSDSIGIELQKRYSIKQLSIILNTPMIEDQPESTSTAKCSLRHELGIAETDRIILYVGNISLNRGLENLIQSVAHLDRCVLVMMGKVTADYAEKLKQVADNCGVSEKVSFFGPVPLNQVVLYASSADIGAAPILNACLSYYYCLPNKLFECMHAGLPTIGSNFPELEKVIAEYEIGKTFDPEDPKDIAASIEYILSDKQRYDRMRHQSVQAAKIFNWANESKKLLAIYDDLGARMTHKNHDWNSANEAG
jgi:glycosyltransferase involved in cell wall biosynthesis